MRPLKGFRPFKSVMCYKAITTFDYFILKGQENYENQMRFGKRTFAELENCSNNGLILKGIQHKVDIVSCSDWKAGACLEGLLLGGLSFGTLPIGIFWSNLDSRQLETCLMTSYCHF